MISVATLVAATCSGVGFAADLPKEGSYDYKACFTRNTTRFQYDADGKLVREEVAGTGMYEEMVTTGTAKTVVPEKEIQPGVTTFCNQLTGTYRMK